MKTITIIQFIATLALSTCLLNACSRDDKASAKIPFTLQFTAKSQGKTIDCHQTFNHFGPDKNSTLGIGDLRFFVSNIRFYNSDNEKIVIKLTNNDFQYTGKKGSVALIDFLGNTADYCASVAEATARTNTQISGTVSTGDIKRVSFDIGVPQALMKSMIAAGPVEDAPFPLNELYWSWAGGYRHFVINFTVMDAGHPLMTNNGAFHIGSMDCGGDMSKGVKALKTRERCGRINTPSVSLENFNPATNTVVVDINKLFSGLKNSDLKRAVWQPHAGNESICQSEARKGQSCITGYIFGVQCHSRIGQSTCQSLFPNFGLDIATGQSSSLSNSIFSME